MPVKISVFLYRNPRLSPEEFRRRYEAHVKMIKRMTGEDFPLSHHRNYIARNTVEIPPEGSTPRNAFTPATILRGQQADFDFDAYAELTFADQAAYQAFAAKIYAPDAAAQIAADEEKFLDRLKLGIALVEEVRVTVK
ncbi:Dimeric alpha-beta barrel [Penicillium paradoxum]|uniref:Dimeric alpha-beta barrel n=1 Tax=Penicillium paradoxum TaxID=176176 RepID=UPI00254706A7|nr:Dimeric alpha-beta barrel [Penicillium paradoxum]KAJ5779805.1 Dimeric alpha-beta barrel [Penicillium paradoxum]